MLHDPLTNDKLCGIRRPLGALAWLGGVSRELPAAIPSDFVIFYPMALRRYLQGVIIEIRHGRASICGPLSQTPHRRMSAAGGSSQHAGLASHGHSAANCKDPSHSSNAHSYMDPQAELDPGMVVLLDCARQAPSFMNSQPWRLQPAQGAVRLAPDRSVQDKLKAADPQGRLLWASIGCAVESVVIAAQADGLSPSVFVRHATPGSLPGSAGVTGQPHQTLPVSTGLSPGLPIQYVEVTIDPKSLQDPRQGCGVATSLPVARRMDTILRHPSKPRHTSSAVTLLDGSRPLSAEHEKLLMEVANACSIPGGVPVAAPTSPQAPPPCLCHTVILTEPSLLSAVGNAMFEADVDPSRAEGTPYAKAIQSYLRANEQDALVCGDGVTTASYGPLALSTVGKNVMSHAGGAAIVCVTEDSEAAWMEAGRSLMRACLAAAVCGVAVTWLHDPAAVPKARDMLADLVKGRTERHGLLPVIAVRLGYIHEGAHHGPGPGVVRLQGELSSRKPLGSLIQQM